MNLNNKGFTLIEILAVIVIIALLGMIAIPSIFSTIDTGKNSSNRIMISNIVTASQLIYEEIENGNKLYQYNKDGITNNLVAFEKDATGNKKSEIKTNLQTLVSNGFLVGTNNDSTGSNKNKKNLVDPKTKEDIGYCNILIKKENNSGNVKYTVTNISTTTDDPNSICPSNYKEVNNG